MFDNNEVALLRKKEVNKRFQVFGLLKKICFEITL